MWKEEKPIIPFNETTHVNIDNINFVTGLRRSVSLDKQIQKYRAEKLSNEAQAQENKLVKPTNCIFQSCLEVGPLITETLSERVALIERIQSVSLELNDQMQYFNIIDEESQKAANILLELTNKADALADRETIELRKEMSLMISRRRQIEAQLRTANKQLKKLQKEKEKREYPNNVSTVSTTSPTTDRDPNKLYFEHFENNKKKNNKPDKKHNGIFTMTEFGYKAWSCCFCQDEHMQGCIDDQSVDLRQNLGNMKRNVHNYIEYPLHPLVTSSSVVLSGNNHMISKFFADLHVPRSYNHSHNNSYAHNSSHTGSHNASHMSYNQGHNSSTYSRPMSGSMVLQGHHSVASHYQQEQRNNRNPNEPFHHRHGHIHHTKKAKQPEQSLAAYTLHHNALQVTPLPSPKGGKTTTILPVAVPAPMWHTTSVVTHDKAREFNELKHSVVPPMASTTATTVAAAAANFGRRPMTANTASKHTPLHQQAAPSSAGTPQQQRPGTAFPSHHHHTQQQPSPQQQHQPNTGHVHLFTHKNNFIGKVRIDPNRTAINRNRPLSSPGGFALYQK